MQPVHQILERNIELFDTGEWLFINPVSAEFYPLIGNTQVHTLHQTVDIYQAATRNFSAITFASNEIADNPDLLRHTTVLDKHTHEFAPYTQNVRVTDTLLYMPKSKSQFAMLLKMAVSCMAAEGNVCVVGENRSGIKSAKKHLQQYGSVTKIDSARHCTLLCLTLDDVHSKFTPQDQLSYQEYHLGDTKWQCATFPGIFSEGQLDKGTELLLQNWDLPHSDNLLDFACGAGVVACFAGVTKRATKLALSDVSAIALYCSALSLKANGLQAQLIAANGLDDTDNTYSHIVSNPPFHTGTKTDYSIVTAFLAQAVHRLVNGGRLLLVANRFLPYAEQLNAHFSQVDVVAQNPQFSVYQSVKRG